MPGLDTLGCVSAIVSGFNGGAELIHTIKERRDKKRRRKEREIEQAFEERMLHRVLVDGATQCAQSSEERHHNFGPAFANGDAIAHSELKDVMVNLQINIISVLQTARAVESTILDLPRLHEAAITYKNSTFRSMDDLCQRIVVALPVHRPFARDAADSFAPITEGNTARSPSLQRHGSDESLVSVQTTRSSLLMPGSGTAQSELIGGSTSRLPSAWQTDESAGYAAAMISPVSSQSQIRQHDKSTMSWMAFKPFKGRGGDHSERKQRRYSTQPESSRKQSLFDLPGLRTHRLSASTLSKTSLNGGQEPSSPYTRSDSVVDQHSDAGSTDAVMSWATSVSPEMSARDASHSDTSFPGFNQRIPSVSVHSPAPNPNDAQSRRASLAPEVMTTESQPTLSLYNHNRHRSTQAPSPRSYHQPSSLRNVHPALREYHYESPATFGEPPSPIVDHPWDPLTRPAKHNNYHGFCKGTWQIRQNVQEGLCIRLVQNQNGNVPYWCCKQCEFRSKAPNDSNHLPDDIFFTKVGIRYRWLFLAKSHIHTNVALNKVESYSYGCIFCAAEGRAIGEGKGTTTFEGIDPLVSHIVSKHKTVLISPDVLERTKCVIGGAPDRADEWDINIPKSQPRRVSGIVGEFVLSAVTGITKNG